jgi:hypothetical protein
MGKSKSCILIGNGPSLRNIDMPSLKDVDTISFNRAYLSYNDEEWGFDPTYYCFIDGNGIRSTVEDLKVLMEKKSNTKRFFINNCKKEFDFSDVKTDRLTEFSKLDRLTFTREMFNIYGENIPRYIDNVKLISNASVFGIELLYTLGYENIGMIGVDAKYVQRKDVQRAGVHTSGPLKGKPKVVFTSDKDPNHYRSDYHGSEYQTSATHLNGIEGNSLEPWKLIKGITDKLPNLNVFSCNKKSRVTGIYPYKSLEDFRKEYL